MKNTATAAYILRALSNMHVGSGDNNYGIVDKQVQRDVIDPFPTIHSSGLKGAFRELFESKLNPKSEDEQTKRRSDELEENIEFIFGSKKKDTNQDDQSENNGKKEKKKFKAGNYHFFNAKLIGLPVRSNQHPFYMATSIELMKEMAAQLQIFHHPKATEVTNAVNFLNTNAQAKAIEPLHFGPETDLVLEDYKATSVNLPVSQEFTLLQNLLGERIALFNHADLKRIAKDLPIIARNNLENGESINLWYEEVVPRESRFYFLMKYYHTENASNLFDGELGKHHNMCQIGGNASIGYGYNAIQSL